MDDEELVPRTLLFSKPDRSGPELSFDGRYIAFFAPNEKGVQNVWVQTSFDTTEPTQLTFDNGQGILAYFWTYLPNVLVYCQDNDGDENFKLYLLDVSNKEKLEPRAIYSQPNVQATVLSASIRQPNKLIIGVNDENPEYHDIYEFDLTTSEKRRILSNSRFFIGGIIFDNDLNVRLAGEATEDGGIIYYRPSDTADSKNLTSAANDWMVYTTVAPEDYEITMPILFSADNTQIYWTWGPGSDLGRLAVHPFGQPTENRYLYEPQKVEIDLRSILIHPEQKKIFAVTEQVDKPEVKILNNEVEADFSYLRASKTDGIPLVTGTSEDFMTWLIEYVSDQYPLEYWLYDRRQKSLRFLFNKQPQLKGKSVAKMHGVIVTARDGCSIPSYLSIPLTATKLNQADSESFIPLQPQKLILLVHGGPRSRVEYGFSEFVVWLTNRNYAVMQCNYRGSTGYGKRHVNAGNGEWAGKMHQDLLDAVDWAVSKGIADPQQIAIMGGSYGGYATLVGLTFTPDKFSCGVDIVGPSNLMTFLGTIPPYWAGFRKRLITMIGADTDSDAGKEYLKNRSPLFFAHQVTKPLLILQGGNDPRVNKNESDQFVKALQDNKIPVTYVVYPNEGHDIQRTENLLSVTGFIEKFLAGCLHGRYEQYTAGMYDSSAIIAVDIA
uniref:Peptidase S9 prolyl oligopeptidase catalytic domain-containing protein n=1 Tax=Plectus sambesii TaxID=2011161 RepID=A0A914VS77_9BILA